MSLEITVLVDDRSAGEALRAEHGLCLQVRGPFGRWLLDAAATPEVLEHNAEALGVDLAGVEAVVLSHGHRDHGGGLAMLAVKVPGLKLYCHPGAFEARYVERTGRPLESVSLPVSQGQLRGMGAKIIEVTSPVRLHEGLILSGPIGGPNRHGGSFAIRRGDELVTDDIADELFLLARGQDGWVVLTGCCHRGLPNTLHLARFLTREEPIVAVVGGLHLHESGETELKELIDVLDKHGRPALHGCHCTGEPALKYLTEHYAGRLHTLAAGMTLEF